VTVPVHCEVVRRYPVALVVATGALRLDTAHILRATVLKVLADRPPAIVLDLAGLDAPDPAAATVLPLLDQHALRAGSVLVLAAPSIRLRSELHRLGVDIAVHATRPAALTAAAGRPVPSRVRLVFAPSIAAPALARKAVNGGCELWGLPPTLATRVAQVANELVTNVVEHAGTDGLLLLTRKHSLLHLAVRDGSLVRPVAGAGFGLAIVGALSSRWGVRTVPDGKVVWATLRIWPAAGAFGRTGSGQ
jgi:anti-anti-sigma regulatory factor